MLALLVLFQVAGQVVDSIQFPCIMSLPSCELTFVAAGAGGYDLLDYLRWQPASAACGDASASFAFDVTQVGNAFIEGSDTMFDILKPTAVFGDSSVYSLGSAPEGGDFRLCIGRNPTAWSDFVPISPISPLFSVTGPALNQDRRCTLGEGCVVQLTGSGLVKDGPIYYLWIQEDDGANGCSGTLIDYEWSVGNPSLVDDDATDTLYNLGFTKQSPQSGVNLCASCVLCWAGHYNDVDAADVAANRVRVGTFRMDGPMLPGNYPVPATEIPCYRNSPCVIQLVGTNLASTNRILIMEIDNLCGNGNPNNFGGASTNPATASSADPTVYDFGSLVSDPGPIWELCWAHNPTQQPQSYRTSAGTLAIWGPDGGDKGCFLSFVCSVQITGYNLKAGDALLVSVGGGCGSATPSDNLALASDFVGHVNPVLTAGATQVVGQLTGYNKATFSIGTATAGATGRYDLCFSGTGERPLSRFTNRLGYFFFRGPYSPQDFVCTMGFACNFNLPGYNMEGPNFLGVFFGSASGASVCGNQGASVPVDFSPFDPVLTYNGGNLQERPYPTGTPTTGTPGLQFELCWAYWPNHPDAYYNYNDNQQRHSGVYSDFIASIGSLDMYGPISAPLQCSLGIDCGLTIAGVGLASTNAILLIEGTQCGVNGATKVTWEGFTSKMTGVTGITGTTGSTGMVETYALGTPLSGEPGDYQLCWAHETTGPNVQFNVPTAIMTLKGPSQTVHQCTLSMLCVITITGVSIGHGAIILAPRTTTFEVCVGNQSEVAGVAQPAVMYNADTEAQYEFGIPRDGLNGFSHTICWVPILDSPRGSFVTLADDISTVPTTKYTVTIGGLEIVGPDMNQTLQDCTLGLACEVEFLGYQLHILNSLEVKYGECSVSQPVIWEGVPNPIMATNVLGGLRAKFSFSVPVMGSAGTYNLCWNPNIDEGGVYHTLAGTIRLAGPKLTDAYCTLSVQCILTVAGVRMADSSRIAFLRRSSLCGSGAAAGADIGSFAGVTNPEGSTIYQAIMASIHGELLYDFGYPVGGNTLELYRFCWGHQPGTVVSNINAKVGTFYMYGPTQGMTAICMLGSPCNVAVTGTGLMPTNSMLIIKQDANLPCGSELPVYSTIPGYDNPRLVTDDSQDNNFAFGIAIGGGSLGDCMAADPAENCVGSHYRLCWAHDPVGNTTYAFDWSVDVGSFEMKGPFVGFSIGCVLGIPCYFHLYGTGFEASNAVMVVDSTSSSCGDEFPAVPDFPGVSNPQAAAVVDQGNTHAQFTLGTANAGMASTFRLCWASAPLVLLHYNVEIGPFTFEAPENRSIFEEL